MYAALRSDDVSFGCLAQQTVRYIRAELRLYRCAGHASVRTKAKHDALVVEVFVRQCLALAYQVAVPDAAEVGVQVVGVPTTDATYVTVCTGADTYIRRAVPITAVMLGFEARQRKIAYLIMHESGILQPLA